MASVSADVKLDVDAIMKKPIDQLTMDELRVRLKEVEKREQIFEVLPDKNDLSDLKDDDWVFINVPRSPTGDVININGYIFEGECRVPYATARTLQEMVSNLWKNERERLTSRDSHNLVKGAIINVDDIAKIRRYKEIMNA